MPKRRAAAVLLLLLGLVTGAAAQQRTPVLLVPGWFGDAAQLDLLRRRFVAAGWPDSAVLAVDFESHVGANVAHAYEVAAAVERLRARTGAREVDVVAHSMGGLATRWYLGRLGGADRVRRVVFLATPHRGTWAAVFAWGGGRADMLPGSAFLERLNRGPPVPAGVEAYTVRTPFDLRIFPPSSATLPGARDVVVCCPSHPGLLFDPATFGAILQILEG